MIKNQIICAIDTKDTKSALNLCNEIAPHVGLIKLGLEFFTMHGPEGVRAIKTIGLPIFLDLKFHDIPNTVAESVRSAVHLGVAMLTIHTSGGKIMMKAAVNAAKDEAKKLGIAAPMVLGVTMLTSMDAGDVEEIGITRTIPEQVLALAKLAVEAGLDGIVCSPLEVGMIKRECGNKLKLIVPGIRPSGGDKGDQKRVMTPAEAINSGADFIVIGRPITTATIPADAARAIAEEIKNA